MKKTNWREPHEFAQTPIHASTRQGECVCGFMRQSDLHVPSFNDAMAMPADKAKAAFEGHQQAREENERAKYGRDLSSLEQRAGDGWEKTFYEGFCVQSRLKDLGEYIIARQTPEKMISFIYALIAAVREDGRKEWENVNRQYMSREEAFQEGRHAGLIEAGKLVDEIQDHTKKGQNWRRGFMQGQKEERQFILNVLDGIDAADAQLGLPPNTRAIRHALQSRVIQ